MARMGMDAPDRFVAWVHLSPMLDQPKRFQLCDSMLAYLGPCDSPCAPSTYRVRGVSRRRVISRAAVPSPKCLGIRLSMGFYRQDVRVHAAISRENAPKASPLETVTLRFELWVLLM
jgi:hypothetical protein